MSTPFSIAANAYGAVQKLAGQAGQALTPEVRPPSQTPDFAALVSESVGEVLDAGRASDRKAMEMVNGQSNVVDVVTAISETEVALETLVTVRDKVISAYEEIMRMPI